MLDLVWCKKDNLMWRKGLADGTQDFKLEDGHCICNAGVGRDWMTVYIILTEEGFRGRGEATRLLTRLKRECEETRRKLAVWCPLNEHVTHICERLEIETYGME